MSDDASKRPNPPQPSPNTPEGVLARAGDLVRVLRDLIRSPATEIEPERSGLLSPPHTPSDRTEGDDAGGAAKARHPAAEKPLPSPSEIGRNPKAYLPPPPAHGRDTGRGR